MKGNGVYSIGAIASVKNFVKADTRVFLSSRKKLCWKCQKDVPMNLGRSSFIAKNRVGGITSENRPQRFICFACRPEIEEQK